jgi:excisionase family DNA binding protein
VRFTAAELTEIRSAFKQRLARDRLPKRRARRERKLELRTKRLPALVVEPDYDDAEILSPAQIAELFAVTSRTVRRWTDLGTLPSFRTVGGQRRFRWDQTAATTRSSSVSGYRTRSRGALQIVLVSCR